MNGLDRIREAAARDRNLRFTSLMHHITEELLLEAYNALKRNAASGVGLSNASVPRKLIRSCRCKSGLDKG